MKLPEELRFTVSADGRPLAGMLVKLEFPMAAKNPHRMVFGPSDPSGEIYITGYQITSEAKKTQDLFPMDYNRLEVGWDGRLRARPMSLSMIKRALSAFEKFGGQNYAPGYENHLQAAQTALAQMPEAVLTIELNSSSLEAVAFETKPVRAGK